MSNIDILYQSLIKRPQFKDLSIDKFKKDMQDDNNRKALFGSLSKIPNFPQVDYDTFTRDMGYGYFDGGLPNIYEIDKQQPKWEENKPTIPMRDNVGMMPSLQKQQSETPLDDQQVKNVMYGDVPSGTKIGDVQINRAGTDFLMNKNYGKKPEKQPEKNVNIQTPALGEEMSIGKFSPIYAEEEQAPEVREHSFIPKIVQAINAGASGAISNLASYAEDFARQGKNMFDVPIVRDVLPTKWLFGKEEEFFKGVKDYFKNDANKSRVIAEIEGGKDFTQLWKEGKYMDAAQEVYLKATESLPLSLAVITTTLAGMPNVGMGLMYASSAGGQMDQLSSRTDMTESQKQINAHVTGLIEALSEKLGDIPIANWLKRIYSTGGKAAVNQASKNIFRSVADKAFSTNGLLFPIVSEGIEESAGQFGQNAVSYVTGETDKLDLMKDVGKSFVYGSAGGSQFAAVGAPGLIKNTIAKKNITKKAQQASDNVDNLFDGYDTQALKGAMKGKTEDEKIEVLNSIATGEFTDEQKDAIFDYYSATQRYEALKGGELKAKINNSNEQGKEIFLKSQGRPFSGTLYNVYNKINQYEAGLGEYISSLSNDEIIDSLNNGSYDEDIDMVLRNYVSTRSMFDGAVSAMREQADTEIAQIHSEIDATTRKDGTRLIVQTEEINKQPGQTFYVTGGNIALDKHGNVIRNQSDTTLTVTNEAGETQILPINAVATASYQNAQDAKDKIAADITARYEDMLTKELDTDPIEVKKQEGAEITWYENGQPRQGIVIDKANGHVRIQEGNKILLKNEQELNEQLKNPTELYHINDTMQLYFDGVAYDAEITSEKDPDGRYTVNIPNHPEMINHDLTAEEITSLQTAPVVENTDETTEETIENEGISTGEVEQNVREYPKNEKGEIDFDKMDIATTFDYLKETEGEDVALEGLNLSLTAIQNKIQENDKVVQDLEAKTQTELKKATTIQEHAKIKAKQKEILERLTAERIELDKQEAEIRGLLPQTPAPVAVADAPVSVEEITPEQQAEQDFIATLPKITSGDKAGRVNTKKLTPEQAFQYTKIIEGTETAIKDIKDEMSAIYSDIRAREKKLQTATGTTKIDIREDIKGLKERRDNLKTILDREAPGLEAEMKAQAEKKAKIEAEVKAKNEAIAEARKNRVLTEEEKNNMHNSMVQLIREYNGLPANYTQKKRVIFAEISKKASQLGYSTTVFRGGQFSVVDKEGKPIRTIAQRTSKEEINEHQLLTEYEPEFQEFALKLMQSMPETLDFPNTNVEKAVKDITAGIKSVAANRMLDRMEEMYSSGEIIIRATAFTPEAMLDITSYFALFEQETDNEIHILNEMLQHAPEEFYFEIYDDLITDENIDYINQQFEQYGYEQQQERETRTYPGNQGESTQEAIDGNAKEGISEEQESEPVKPIQGLDRYTRQEVKNETPSLTEEQSAMTKEARKSPTSVRELADMDAEDNNGYLSAGVLTTVEQGQSFKVGSNRTYTVTKKSKPNKVQYENEKFKGEYTRTSVTIKDDKGKTYSFEMWDDWTQNGKRMVSTILRKGSSRSGDPVAGLSRDIEGDITIDLINEYNQFHDKSDSYKILNKYILDVNRKLGTSPIQPTPETPSKQSVETLTPKVDTSTPKVDTSAKQPTLSREPKEVLQERKRLATEEKNRLTKLLSGKAIDMFREQSENELEAGTFDPTQTNNRIAELRTIEKELDAQIKLAEQAEKKGVEEAQGQQEVSFEKEKPVEPKSIEDIAKEAVKKNEQSKVSQAQQEADEALKDFLDAFNDLQSDNLGIIDNTAEKQAKMLVAGTKMVGAFTKLGIYKFADVIKNIASKGIQITEDLLSAIKKAYGAFAAENDIDELDDMKTVRSFTLTDLQQNKNEDLTPKENNSKKNNVSLDGDKKAFVSAIKDKLGVEKLNIVSIRKIAAENGFGEIKDTTLQEYVELALIEKAKEIVAQNISQQEKYNQIVELYNAQPTISMRSSERIEKQQYSTPLPISFLAGEFINIASPETVLEPSAGNGMMVFNVNTGSVIANEIDEVRLDNLREQPFKEVTNQDGTREFNINPVDAVVTNPPFGKSDVRDYEGYKIAGLDEQMVVNALSSMNDNGIASIIIGGHTKYKENGKLASEIAFLNYLYDKYNVTDIINIDGGLYSKQGTSFPVRLILINGRRTGFEALARKYAPLKKDAKSDVIKSFEELYTRVKNHENNVLHQRASVQPDNTEETTGGNGGTVQGGTATINRPGDRTGGQPGSSGTRPTSNGGQSNKPTRPAPVDDAGGSDIQPDDGSGKPSTNTSIEGNGRRVQSQDAEQFLDRSNERPEPLKVDLEAEKTPYPARSKSDPIGSVVPTNVAQTLNDILYKFKDIDAYVQTKLGYTTKEEMFSALAAEQIDSVAMAIYQIENGKALIIGDMTGVGKGRQAAAIIRYAVLSGKKPIFVTEKAALFSDMYRDLRDIGSGDLKPFIINSKGKEDPSMTDENGVVIYSALPDVQKRPIISSGNLPSKYDYTVLTYSQLNGNAEKNGLSPKQSFFRNLAADNILILDESHNAGGEGNTGKFITETLNFTKGVVFLSGTFAKRADNMPIYAMKTSMKDANMSDEELIEAIKKGGVPLQEIMSKNLTESGQMIRRERDFTGVTIDWQTMTDKKEEHYKTFDGLIDVFNQLIHFQQDYIDPIIGEMSDALAAEQGGVGARQGTAQLGISNVPFASKTFNLVRQMLFSLKAKEVASEAIKELKAGRKPVIAIGNTMGSFLNELGSVDDVLSNYDYSLTLLRGLTGLFRITRTDAQGNKYNEELSKDILTPEGLAKYNELEATIKKLSSGISISPIDVIKAEIVKSGFTIGEMTGRDNELVFNEDGTATISKRTNTDKKKLARDFNAGDIDVLILNQSASTGISLHASSKFKDQRQRVMLFAQNQLDVNTEVQMRGRIDRTGQVVRGAYRYIISPIPAEQRMIMMFKAKLKSLDANTTSSQKSKVNEIEVVDFLNKYGDEIVIEYLKENPDINTKMLDPFNMEAMSPDTLAEFTKVEGAANKASGRAALLAVKEQETFYTEITEKYTTLLNYLNDSGTNDLEITTVPLRAETIAKHVVVQGNNNGSPFSEDSIRETVEVDVLKKPMSLKEVDEQIENLTEGLEPSEYKDMLVKRIDDYTREHIEKEYNKITEEFKKKGKAHFDKIEAAFEKDVKAGKRSNEDKALYMDEKHAEYESLARLRVEANTRGISQRGESVRRLFRMIPVGRIVMIPSTLDIGTDTTYTEGMFLGFRMKDKLTPSTITAVFAPLDGRRRIDVPLSKVQFLQAVYAETSQNIRHIKATRENWDSSIPTKTRKTAYIITGNILQAYGKEGMAGQLVSYTTIKGEIKQGVFLNEKYKASEQTMRVQVIEKINELRNGENLVDASNNVIIRKEGSNAYTISVPLSKAQGGKYFLDPGLRDLVLQRDFRQLAGRMIGVVNEANIEKALRYLSEKHNISVDTEMKEVKDDDAAPQFQAISPIGFYSTVEKALEAIQQEKGSKDQFKAMLLKNGAKQAEMDWMGFDELPDKLTKADIQNWIDQNRIEVQEVQKGGFEWKGNDLIVGGEVVANLTHNEDGTWSYQSDFSEGEEAWETKLDAQKEAEEAIIGDAYSPNATKFSGYVLPGGENYKELLLTMPAISKYDESKLPDDYRLEKSSNGNYVITKDGVKLQGTVISSNKEEVLASYFGGKSEQFKSHHYDEPNILAHIRFDERIIPSKKAEQFDIDYDNWVKNGKKGEQPDFKKYGNDERVLFIEEIQSDWAQTGKKEGFKEEDSTDINSLYEKKDELQKKAEDDAGYTYKLNERWEFITELQKRFPNRKANGTWEYEFGISVGKEDWQLKYQEQDRELKALNNKADKLLAANEDYDAVLSDIQKYERNRNAVPDMPFKKTDQWVNLAARRMMRYAAENGFDRIAWTSGKIQADRYDLSKQVDEIEVNEEKAGNLGRYIAVSTGGNSKAFAFFNHDGIITSTGGHNLFDNAKGKHLSDVIGKELTQRVIESNNGAILKGSDLKVGGEGMKAFYDAIVPSAMSKLGKPFGAKVETIEIPETGMQQSIPVTNSMKETAMAGLPLYHTGTTMKRTSKKEVSAMVEQLFKTGLASEVRMVTPEEIAGILEGNEQLHTVYHGSPHSFDRFSLNHIGTGEGQQAYGWGLYFTDKEDIARAYAERLSNRIDKQKNFIQRLFGNSKNKNIYKVNVEGDNWISWDKPISESQATRLAGAIYKQSNHVISKNRAYDALYTVVPYKGKQLLTGKEVYKFISKLLKGDKNASIFLNKYGFSGIKYPAKYHLGNSNNKDFNYVVFDENAISIKKKVQFFRTPTGTIYGFVKDGVVYLNSDTPNLNSPIHEFGHLWIDAIEGSELYDRGEELVKETTYWERVNADPNYKNLSETARIKEAMAMAIGDNGESVVNDNGLKAKLKRWISDVWKRIGSAFGINNLTSEQISKLSFKDFVDIATSELLSGENLTENELSNPFRRLDKAYEAKEYEQKQEISIREALADNDIPKPDDVWKDADTIFKPKRIVFNEDNIAVSLYKHGIKRINEIHKLSDHLLSFEKGGFPIINKEKASAFRDAINPEIDKHVGMLQQVKHLSTPAAQQIINELIEDARLSKDYYDRYAKGEDVWRTEKSPRFQIIGEQGASNLDAAEEATTRLDNLRVAKEMEGAKTPQEIRLATGWEKGADGLWRYETAKHTIHPQLQEYLDKSSDGFIKWINARLNHGLPVNLQDIYGTKDETLKSLPQLRTIPVKIVSDAEIDGSIGLYSPETKTILINSKIINDQDKVLSVLEHEVQHAIQHIEGFAKGGNLNLIKKKHSELISGIDFYNDLLSKASKEGNKELYDKLMNLKLDKVKNLQLIRRHNENPYDAYLRLSGEVEARNAQTRMNYTDEQRRNTLLSETAEVAPEDQIIIMDGLGVSMSMTEDEVQAKADKIKNEGLKSVIPDYIGFLKNVYDAVPDSARRFIIDRSKDYGWDIGRATEEYLASFVKGVSPAELDKIAELAGLQDLAPSEIKMAFWDNFNPKDDSPEYIAKRSLAVYDSRDGVLPEKPTIKQVQEVYERIVTPKRKYNKSNLLKKETGKHAAFRVEESYANSLASLRVFMDIIGEVPDKYNPYYLMQLYTSAASTTMDRYEKKEFKDMMEALTQLNKKLEKAEGLNYLSRDYKGEKGEINRGTLYALAKAGLDRNERLARKNAADQLQPEYKKLSKQLLKGEIDQEAYEDMLSILSDKENQLAEDINAKHDFGGLTGLAKLVGSDAENFEDIRGVVEDIVAEAEGAVNTDDFWTKTKTATSYVLTYQYNRGMMSKELYEEILEMEPHYVPLRGYDEATAGDVYEYFTSFKGEFNPVLKKAEGHEHLPENPFAHIKSMTASGVLQAEKNRAKQALLNLVENHENDLVTAGKSWIRNIGTEEMPEWEDAYPVIPEDATPEQVTEAINDFENKMKELASEGKAAIKSKKLKLNLPIGKGVPEEHTIKVRRNGEERTMYVNGNPRLAQAINGMLNPDAKDTAAVLKVVKAINRGMSANFTSRNLEFAITNTLRDLHMAIALSGIEEGIGYSVNLAKNAVVAQRTLASHIFGSGTKGKYQDYLQEFLENGGQTGFVNLRSVERYHKDIKKLERELRKKDPFAIPKWIFGQIEDVNQMGELISRFATYITSREAGRSVTRSSVDAKNITLNFNQKGTGELGASWFQNLILFFNPAMQALYRANQARQKHPARFWGVMGAHAAAGAMVPMLTFIIAGMMGDDDDKKEMEEAYWNTSTWIRRNNLMIWIPKTKSFITIPLGQELRWAYSIGEIAFTKAMGKDAYGKNVGAEMVGAVTAMLPVDMFGASHWYMPGFATPIYEASINENFMGNPIYKSTPWNENDPSHTKAYSRTWKGFVNVSKKINELTGGDDVTKGKVDINPAVAQHMVEGYLGGLVSVYLRGADVASAAMKGEEYTVNEVPFLRRVYKVSDKTMVDRSVKREYFDILNDLEKGYGHKELRWRQKNKEFETKYNNAIKDLQEQGVELTPETTSGILTPQELKDWQEYQEKYQELQSTVDAQKMQVFKEAKKVRDKWEKDGEEFSDTYLMQQVLERVKAIDEAEETNY